MNTVLVTGANGFVGQAVAMGLVRRGFAVVCAARSECAIPGAKSICIPDLAMPVDWSKILGGVDCIVHTAAHVHVQEADGNDYALYNKVNIRATLNLAQAAADNGVRRLIFLSSVKVNGEATEPGKPFTEKDKPNPQDNYSLSKYKAEEGLFVIAKQTGLEVIVIRPPLVYGPGVKANFAELLDVLQKRIPLPFAGLNNKRSFIYLGNLVSFIDCCIRQPAAANEVFLVSDGDDLSTTELLTLCADALGIKALLLPVPKALIKLAAKTVGKPDSIEKLCGSLQVDIRKAKQLGWRPPFSVNDGLAATAAGLGKDVRKPG